MASIDKIYPLTIDLLETKQTSLQKNIMFNEEDRNTAFINAEIKNGGEIVDLTGVTVHLNTLAPDGEIKQKELSVIDLAKGIVKLEFQKDILSSSGLLRFQVQFTKASKITVSPSYFIKVDEANVTDEVVQSQDSFPILTQMLNRVESGLNTLTTIAQSEQSRVDGEKERVKSFREMKENISTELLKIDTKISNSTELGMERLKQDLNTTVETKLNQKASEVDATVNNKIDEITRKDTELSQKLKQDVANAIQQIPSKDELKGRDGRDGTSIIVLGTKNNVTELPRTGNNIGDAYIINRELHIWTKENKWANVGSFKGDKGDSAYDLWIKKGNSGSEDVFVQKIHNAINSAERITQGVARLEQYDTTMQGYAQKENERNTAEQTRIQNENARVSQETARQGQETERDKKERQRVTAELSRVESFNHYKQTFDDWIANKSQFKGDTGRGLIFKGVVETKSALPQTGNEQGFVYGVKSGADKGLYIYSDSNQWSYMGEIRGADGESVSIRGEYFYIGENNTNVKIHSDDSFVKAEVVLGNTLKLTKGNKLTTEIPLGKSYENATITKDGLMSSADKKALEDIKKDIQTATTKLNDMASDL
jgi:hypothetical protein